MFSAPHLEYHLSEYHRPDLDLLVSSLTELGATHVFTYEALEDKSLTKHIKKLTASSVCHHHVVFLFQLFRL